MNEEQLKLLYDTVGSKHGFKDFNEYKSLLSTPESRKLYFESSNNDLGFKNFDEFETLLNVEKKNSTNGSPVSSPVVQDGQTEKPTITIDNAAPVPVGDQTKPRTLLNRETGETSQFGPESMQLKLQNEAMFMQNEAAKKNNPLASVDPNVFNQFKSYDNLPEEEQLSIESKVLGDIIDKHDDVSGATPEQIRATNLSRGINTEMGGLMNAYHQGTKSFATTAGDVAGGVAKGFEVGVDLLKHLPHPIKYAESDAAKDIDWDFIDKQINIYKSPDGEQDRSKIPRKDKIGGMTTSLAMQLGEANQGYSPSEFYDKLASVSEQNGWKFTEQLKALATEAKQDESKILEGQLKENPVIQGAEDWKEFQNVIHPTNPEYKDSFWASTLPGAAGSLVAYVAAEAITKPLGLPPGLITAGVASMQNAGSSFDEAWEKTKDPAIAAQAWVNGALIGSTEALPLGAFLKRLDKITGGKATDTLRQTLTKAVVRSGKQGLEEGIQEWSSDVLNNLSAQQLYDASRDIFTIEGLESGAAGLLLGAIMQGGAEMMNKSSGPERQLAKEAMANAQKYGGDMLRQKVAELTDKVADGSASLHDRKALADYKRTLLQLAKYDPETGAAPSVNRVPVVAPPADKEEAATEDVSEEVSTETQPETPTQPEIDEETEPVTEEPEAPDTPEDLESLPERQAALTAATEHLGRNIPPETESPAVDAPIAPDGGSVGSVAPEKEVSTEQEAVPEEKPPVSVDEDSINKWVSNATEKYNKASKSEKVKLVEKVRENNKHLEGLLSDLGGKDATAYMGGDVVGDTKSFTEQLEAGRRFLKETTGEESPLFQEKGKNVTPENYESEKKKSVSEKWPAEFKTPKQHGVILKSQEFTDKYRDKFVKTTERRQKYVLKQDYDNNGGDPIAREEFDTYEDAKKAFDKLQQPDEWGHRKYDHYASIEEVHETADVVYDENGIEDSVENAEEVDYYETKDYKSFGGSEKTADELRDDFESRVWDDIHKSEIETGNGKFIIHIPTNHWRGGKQTGKYTDIDIKTLDGKDVERITIRIADHSYNPANNSSRGQSDFISVNIANENQTKERFHGSKNLDFDGDATYEEIIEAVKENIADIINGWDVEKKVAEKNDLDETDGEDSATLFQEKTGAPDVLYRHLKRAQEHSNRPKYWNSGLSEAQKAAEYVKKEKAVVNAIKRAKKIGVDVVHDPVEGAVYFETPNGQVSFHYAQGTAAVADWIEENTRGVEDYEWSGKNNSEEIIDSFFPKEGNATLFQKQEDEYDSKVSKEKAKQQAETAFKVFDAMARVWAKATGKKASEFYKRMKITESAEEIGTDETTAQGKKGAFRFKDGQAIVALFEGDISTLIHEVGGHYGRVLLQEMAAVSPDWDARMLEVENWAGVKQGVWTKEAEEKFARGFEKYVTEGRVPKSTPQAVKDAFRKLKDWMIGVYKNIKGSDIDVKIPDNIRKVFDAMVSGGDVKSAMKDSAPKKKEMGFSKTTREEGGTEARDMVKKVRKDNPIYYTPKGRQEMLDRAAEAIDKRGGFTNRNLTEVIDRNLNEYDLLTAERILFLTNLGEQLATAEKEGNEMRANELIDDITKLSNRMAIDANTTGRGNSQLYSYELMGPDGRVKMATRLIDRSNEAIKERKGTDDKTIGQHIDEANKDVNKAIKNAASEVVDEKSVTSEINTAAKTAKGKPKVDSAKKEKAAKKRRAAIENLQKKSGENNAGQILFQEQYPERKSIENKAKADGTWMKAPNGKDTNLSEEQWVTVRTKAFKKWFGDWESNPEKASKVVDENGEPRVVYHGSRSVVPFYEFDGASFFSDNQEVAKLFAESAKYTLTVDGITRDITEDEATSISGFIEPYESVDWHTGMNLVEAGGMYDIGGLKGWLKTYYGDKKPKSVVIDYNPAHKTTDAEASIRPMFLNIRNPKIKDYEGELWGGKNGAIETDIDTKNYDGYIAKNIQEGGLSSTEDFPVANTYVTFNPNQIKSATKNSGDFDIENPSILFQEASQSNASQDPDTLKVIQELSDSIVEEGNTTETKFKREFRASMKEAGIAASEKGTHNEWLRVKDKADKLRAEAKNEAAKSAPGAEKIAAKDIRDIINKHYSEQSEYTTRESLSAKLQSEAGVDKESADRLAELIQDKIKQRISDAVKQAAQNVLKQSSKVGANSTKTRKTYTQKMHEAINKFGQLTEEDFTEIFNKRFDFAVPFSSTELRKLRQLSQAIQGMSPGISRSILFKEYFDTVRAHTKTYAGTTGKAEELVDDMIFINYQSMLSGPSTAILNAVSGGMSMAMKPLWTEIGSGWMRDIKNKDFGLAVNPLIRSWVRYKAMAQGMKTGSRTYFETMRGGEFDSKWEEGVTGVKPFQGTTKLQSSKAGKIIGTPTRNLAAMDRAMVAALVNSEVSAVVMDALAKNPDLKNSPRRMLREVSKILSGHAVNMVEINDRIEQESAEVEKATGKPMTYNQKQIRARELIYQSIDAYNQHEQSVSDLAAQTIFTGERGGMASKLAKVLSEALSAKIGNKMAPPLVQKLTTLLIKIPFLPFSRIPSNTIEYMADFMPLWGQARAFGISPSSWIRGAGGKSAQMGAVGTRQFWDQIGRSVFGTALFATMLALSGDDPDDFFYVYGAQGEEPYTVKIGPLKFKYNNIPGANAIFGFIGGLNDAKKFGVKGQDLYARTYAVLQSVGLAIKDQSFLKGVNDLFEIIYLATSDKEEDRARATDKLLQKIVEPVARINPAKSGLAEQTALLFDGRRFTKEDVGGYGNFLGVLERLDPDKKTRRDIFGNQIKTPFLESVGGVIPSIHHIKQGFKDEMGYRFLYALGVSTQGVKADVGPIYNGLKVFEKDENEPGGGFWRRMNDDELDRYSELAGKKFAKELGEIMKLFEKSKDKLDFEKIEKHVEGQVWEIRGKKFTGAIKEHVKTMWEDAKTEARKELFKDENPINFEIPKGVDVLTTKEIREAF